MSDRDFHALLWNEWLDEPTADIPLEAETNTTLIVSELNANGMTHEEIWLRYYASDGARAKHAKDCLKDTLPPKEKPAFNRGLRLPKRPF